MPLACYCSRVGIRIVFHFKCAVIPENSTSTNDASICEIEKQFHLNWITGFIEGEFIYRLTKLATI